MDNLEKRLLLAYADAIASKGKNKGMLKAKCPPMGTDGAVMWQACMLIANPYKASIFNIMFSTGLDREFWQACDQFAQSRKGAMRLLDRDRVALEKLGVW